MPDEIVNKVLDFRNIYKLIVKVLDNFNDIKNELK